MRYKLFEGRSLGAALVLLVLTATTPLVPASAAETENFGLSPHPEFRRGTRRSLSFGLSPGSSARDAVRIYNKTERRLRLVVYSSDASRSEDGTIHIPPTGSPPSAIGTWVTMEATEVVLAPKQERVLSFTVARPKESQSGGIAAIVAEEAGSEGESGESVEIVTRLALVIRVGEASETGLSVGSVVMEPVIQFLPERAQVLGHLSNQTDSAITVSLAGEVRSITGRNYRLPEQEITLAARETRRISINWDTVPRFGGLMRATIRAAHSEGEASSSSSLEPIVPIWLLMILITVEGWVLGRRMKRRT